MFNGLWNLVLGNFRDRWLRRSLSSEFRYWKWRIKNDGRNCINYLIRMIFGTRGYLGSLITNPSSKFRNLKWRIYHCGPKCEKLLDWDEFWYSGVFGVAAYESETDIQKFKIADAISLTKMQTVTRLGWKLVLGQFWGQHSEIQRGGSNMAN